MKIMRTFQHPGWLDLETDFGAVRLQPVSDRIIRVIYSAQPLDALRPGLLATVPDGPAPGWQVDENAGGLSLTTAALRLEVDKGTGAFTWTDAAGSLLVREPPAGGKQLQEIELGRKKAYSSRLSLQFSDGEAIYGLGQHEEGILNYRGHSQYLYQQNMKVAMPVLVSTRGYALFFDCGSLSCFHDDQHGSYFWSEAVQALDFYFVYGPEFDALVAGIRALSGHPTLFPRWAYGYIQSKERYKRQSELLEVVQEYRRRGIGLDAIVLDWMSWSGALWGQKTLDPDRFPDPGKMMRDLHAENARLLVSVWPHFENDGPDQVEMREHGCLLGDDSTYDAFSPQARALYWQQANRGLFQYGIDGWWADCTEPFEPDWRGQMKLEPWQRLVVNTGTFKQYLDPEQINLYSLYHAQGIYEGQRAVCEEKRVVNLTRSASPGQVRYGTITWSGDITALWETFKKQIADGLNFTVTGSPRWTCDIGGFFVNNRSQQPGGQWFWDGGFPDGCDDRGYRELYTRWFQFGAFLPMFRAHGTDTPREVWRFGKPGELVYDTLVKFIRLRYRLLPYIYSLAAWETFRGYTMLRALAFDFRHDPLVYDIADQFMFGPALLVCPVTEPMYFGPDSTPLEDKPKERVVYLPAGAEWYNFWTGRRYAGGQLIRTPAPLDILPLYVRAGSILPLGPDVQHAGEKAGAPLELRVYPGRDGQFDLYEDEGDSYRYEQGAYTWTPLAWNDSARELTAGPRQGSYPGMPPAQQFRITLGCAGIDPGPAAGEITIAGQESTRWNNR